MPDLIDSIEKFYNAYLMWFSITCHSKLEFGYIDFASHK